MASLKKNKQCTHKFKTYEWTYLVHLLKQGFSVKEAILLLDEHTNIPSLLEQGKSIEQILCENKHGAFYTHLYFFLSITSLPNAIVSALDMEAFEKNMIKKLTKQISYPLFILVFSFVILYLFTSMVLPQLIMSFDLQDENQTLMFTVVLLKWIIQLCFFTMLMTLIIVLAAKNNERLRMKIYAHTPWLHLPKDLTSYRMAGYFIPLIQHDISTKDAFSFLSKRKKCDLITHCATEIKNQLEQGMDLLDALKQNVWINTAFYDTWRIGIHTKDMKEALVSMMRRQEDTWTCQIKYLTIGIQVFAYGFVGVMVLIMYQIMLIPLQLMETM